MRAYLKRHRRVIRVATHQRVHTAVGRHGPDRAVPIIAHVQRVVRRVDRDSRELAKERVGATVAVAKALDAALPGDELDLRGEGER